MVDVIFESTFKKQFKRLKDKSLKEKVIKQISKMKGDSKIGKPMMYERKGTRELYVAPLRISYRLEGEIIYILALYHKDEQ